MNNKYGYIKSDEMSGYVIAHHGIKGQKWGIRKYQNPDGTLTELGKQRYSHTGVKGLRNISRVSRTIGAAGVATGVAGAALSPLTMGISAIPGAVGAGVGVASLAVAGIADLTLHEAMNKTSNKEFEKMKKDRDLMNDPVAYLSAKKREKVNEYTKSK